MQNTRLNTVVQAGADRLRRWLFNPWRRLSVLLMSLLFGFFLATVIITTTGQTADIDILVAAIMMAIVEMINWLRYSWRSPLIKAATVAGASAQPTPLLDALNALKLGLTFGLFVEAFKLGS